MEKNVHNTLTFDSPSGSEVQAVQGLLRACGLPWEDIHDHFDHFLVARQGKRIVGAVGLEHAGSSGVIRSLAVAEEFRGTGIGRQLYRRIVDHARQLGVTELGLLTTTAEGFFEREGFRTCGSEQVPEYVRTTKEYLQYCPSSAVCMTKQIS